MKQLKETARLAADLAQKLLNVEKRNINAATLEMLPDVWGIYIFYFCDNQRPAYIGSALGEHGLSKRIVEQHLRCSYTKSVFRKAVSGDFSIDSAISEVECIKSRFLLSYLACPQEGRGLISIAESILIYTMQPKYNVKNK
jgi:hypothetical protein